MSDKLNEFKFGALRSFGSEQISFNTVIYSPNAFLTKQEIEGSVASIDTFIRAAFIDSEKRANDERTILATNSQKRTEGILALDKAQKAETEAKKGLQRTVDEAERIKNKSVK